MDGRQLRQISENRRWREWRSAVGPLAREVLSSRRVHGPVWRRRLIGVLEEHAGGELLDQAWPRSIQNGVLTFDVENPAAAYALRLQWEQHLLAVLEVQLPAAGIHTVRFAVGRGDETKHDRSGGSGDLHER